MSRQPPQHQRSREAACAIGLFEMPQMYFFAKDERITIIPNFSLPTENGTASCIAVRQQKRSAALRTAGPARPRAPLPTTRPCRASSARSSPTASARCRSGWR